MKTEEVYKTENFYLASFLIAKNFNFVGIEPSKTGQNKFVFCFTISKSLEEMVESFYGLKAVVAPQSFANAQKSLRSVIHERLNNYVK